MRWINRVLAPGLYLTLILMSPSVAEEPASETHHHGTTEEPHHMDGATEAMTGPHQHMELHMKWTTPRQRTPADEARAETILRALRETLVKYRDSRVAIEDGFEPFHPELVQPHYHFTSKWRGFKSAFRFNPQEPTSLLYKKTASGYELEGAMFTAPKRMDEGTLDKRVPLSIGRWHAHVNLCFPRSKATTSTDWTRFGFKGSIATEDACDAAGGKFYAQVFGWMLHVYPFEEQPERIWTH